MEYKINQETRDALIKHLSEGSYQFVAPVVQTLAKLEPIEKCTDKKKK